jgi:hypothetical protein
MGKGWQSCKQFLKIQQEFNEVLLRTGVLNILAALPSADIAQMVEQRIRNA